MLYFTCSTKASSVFKPSHHSWITRVVFSSILDLCAIVPSLCRLFLITLFTITLALLDIASSPFITLIGVTDVLQWIHAWSSMDQSGTGISECPSTTHPIASSPSPPSQPLVQDNCEQNMTSILALIRDCSISCHLALVLVWLPSTMCPFCLIWVVSLLCPNPILPLCSTHFSCHCTSLTAFYTCNCQPSDTDGHCSYSSSEKNRPCKWHWPIYSSPGETRCSQTQQRCHH